MSRYSGSSARCGNGAVVVIRSSGFFNNLEISALGDTLNGNGFSILDRHRAVVAKLLFASVLVGRNIQRIRLITFVCHSRILISEIEQNLEGEVAVRRLTGDVLFDRQSVLLHLVFEKRPDVDNL